MPTPFSISKAECAYMLGVDERSIFTYQNREYDPLPIEREKRGRAHRYDALLVMQWKVRQEVNKLTRNEEGEYLDLEQERARLAKEQRIAQELKNAQTRKETAPIGVIGWSLSKIGGQISAILDAIPNKVKRRIPKLTTAEVEIIKREVIKAQNIAVKIKIDLDDYQPDR